MPPEDACDLLSAAGVQVVRADTSAGPYAQNGGAELIDGKMEGRFPPISEQSARYLNRAIRDSCSKISDTALRCLTGLNAEMCGLYLTASG